MSIFSTLRKIDVGEHIEKKNGLSYLSWAWAWDTLKANYPDSIYTIYEDRNGMLYHSDGKTAWVKTGVTAVDGDTRIEHIEYLPVMDNRNNSIPVEQLTSTAVNKAIQRSLTKAVARHGLGLYIYAGEDLPASDPVYCEDCGAEIVESRLKGQVYTVAMITGNSQAKYHCNLCCACQGKRKKAKLAEEATT